MPMYNPPSGGALGPYANVAALQTANPAATSIGKHATVNGVDYVASGIGANAAWIPAAGVVGRLPIEGWAGSPKLDSSGASTTTWQLQFACRAKPYAVRVSYHTALTSGSTIDKTSITPSTTYVQDGDPTGGASPVNVLFGGSAAAVIPAAASVNVNSRVQSDWTAISPIDRTDVAGGLSLFHIRSYCAANGQGFLDSLAGGSGPYAGNVAAGYIRRGSFMTGDKIATPAGFSGIGGGNILGMTLEFRSLSKVARVGDIGDSIEAGTPNSTNSNPSYLTSYTELGCLYANNQTLIVGSQLSKFWSAMNFGYGGQTVALFGARLAEVLSSFALDAMLIPVFSPNSAPTTQAQWDANMAVVLDMIARCVAARVTPIIVTKPPFNTSVLASDNFRKAANTAGRTIAASYGYPLVDLDAVSSDGASPARWIPAQTDDGLHPNEAVGKPLFGTVVAAALGTTVTI